MKFTIILSLLIFGSLLTHAQETVGALTVNQQKTILAYNGPKENRPAPVALYGKDRKANSLFAAEWLSNQYKSPVKEYSLQPKDERYIGETEKNLIALFDSAKATKAVLFFDEADALFGTSGLTDAQKQQAALLVKLAKGYPGGIIFDCKTKEAWLALADAGCGIVSLD